MEIHIFPRLRRRKERPRGPRLLLERGTPWNDGRTSDDPGFDTLFDVHVDNASFAEPLLLGSVKILRRGARRVELEGGIAELPDDCCSLGQTIDYYRLVSTLEGDLGQQVLKALRDVTAEPERGRRFFDEPGFRTSLLRFSEAARIFQYGAKPLLDSPPAPVPVTLRFRTLLKGFDEAHDVTARLQPGETDVARLTAIAGPNGTGKTQLLARLASALWGLRRPDELLEVLGAPIGRVIAVSYSALDVFDRPPHRLRKLTEHPAFDNYCYCGLRDEDGRLDPQLLSSTLQQDLHEIAQWKRIDLWSAMATEVLPQYALRPDPATLAQVASQLGAGDKTALCVMTRLLSKIRNGAFIIFDEPETNMHPRLLSKMLRVLRGWLHEYDAYGIIATHSPVVLQEIPGRQVIVLERQGAIPFTRPYRGECFGADLSEIVDTVFGVDEQDRNYAGILKRLVADGVSEGELEETFGRSLSLNARMAMRHFSGRRPS